MIKTNDSCPLNISYSKLINNLKGKDYCQWSNKMNSRTKNWDRNKLGKFHNDYEHFRIINALVGVSKISGISISASIAHIRRFNSIILSYDASNALYNHTISFTSLKVKKLSRLSDDSSVTTLNVVNVLFRRVLVDIGVRFRKLAYLLMY